MSELRRKLPEDLLREVEAEEAHAPVGHLKVFLGYASGVGKSFRMLDEARRRRERGQNIVVGAVQPQAPPDVEALLAKLEVIPLLALNGGVAIDVQAILKRKPAVCFIDGLAYNNPPGSRNPTRWQDVRELLASGMKVVGSINIQYVAELREETEALTGKRVSATVPVAFVESADEIEIVDAPPDEPIERTPEQQFDAVRREQRLSKLRELTLVLAADVVDRQLQRYLEEHGIRQGPGAHERVLVCITPRSNAREMIDAARVVAERFHADFLAAYVDQAGLSAADRTALEEKLAAARAAGATVEMLQGEDPVDAILDFAAARGVTQLFIGHSHRSGLRERLRGTPVDRLLRRSRGMDVRVFPQ